jgi:major intracellular serine protease
MTKYLILLLLSVSAQAKIIVAIVDTGLDLADKRFAGKLCKSGHKDYTKTGMRDSVGHGTHVAGIIVTRAKRDDYCLLILKYYDPKASFGLNLSNSTKAFMAAIESGANIVNYSSNGLVEDKEEKDVIAGNPNVTFVVAAGNEGANLDQVNSYPASYKLPGIVAVGNLDRDGTPYKRSNYGSFLVWEVGVDVVSYLPGGKTGPMTGTSMATAIRTSRILNTYK